MAHRRLDNPKGYPHYHTDDYGCYFDKRKEKEIKERSNLQKLLDTTPRPNPLPSGFAEAAPDKEGEGTGGSYGVRYST